MTVNISAISPVRKSALGFAAQIKAGDALDSAFTTAYKAAEDNQQSSYVVFVGLTQEFGDAIAEWPKPGTGQKDNEPNSNNPDYWSVPVSDGSIKGSFYNDLSDNSPSGKAIAAELEKIASAKAKTAENEYSTMDDDDVARAKAKWTKRQQTLRNKVREAMRFYFHLRTVSDYDGIVVHLDKNADGSLKIGNTQPIRVVENIVGGRGKYYSVPGFLRLDVDLAKEKGGGWSGLVKSDQRPPATPETKYPPIKGMEDFDSALATVGNFLADLQRDKKAENRILAELLSGKHDHVVKTLFMVEAAAGMFTNVKALQDRNDKLSGRVADAA